MIRNISKKDRLSLRKDILKTVVLVTSKDPYRVKSAVDKINQGLNRSGEYAFDCEHLTPKDGDLAAALERAMMLPLGAERRVLVVTEVQEANKEQAARIEEYLKRGVSTSSLVLAGAGIKRESKVYKLAAEYGDVLEFEEFGKNEYPALIREAFASRGKKISNRAVSFIRDNLGNDLETILIAVEKIDLYHEGRNEIDVEDVAPFVTASAERTIFELIDQVSARDLNRSLKLMESMLKQGKDDSEIFHMLVWHFRRLIVFKALDHVGADEKEIVKRLGIKPYDRKAHFRELNFAPAEVELPLQQHIGAPAVPVIKSGDRVVKGQVIAEVAEEKLGCPVHASISGIVAAVSEKSIVIKG